MGDFVFKKSELDGVILILPRQFTTDFGEFNKYFEKETFESNGISFKITEEYQLISNQGVLRGIHFQDPNPQARLVSVSRGEALIVIVDLRIQSNQLGQWKSYKVGNQEKTVIFVPKGFGLGTLALEDKTAINVKCSGTYFEKNSRGIYYDDKDLSIDWKKEQIEKIRVSEKDKMLLSFQEYVKSKSM